MEFKCFNWWDQLPPHSDTLFAQAEKESLFFSLPWYKNLTTTSLKKDQSLVIASVIDDDNKPLAILPLINDNSGNWVSLNHVMLTSLYTLILAQADKQQQQSTIECLAKGLSQLSLQSLMLAPIAENDEPIRLLRLALESYGFECNRFLRFANWYHLVEEQTGDDYMASRPSILRNTIARKQRKLAREHNYQIRLYTDKIPQSVLEDYYAVFKASWKPKEIYRETISGFIRTVSQQGWTRLAILYIDKQPAAAQLWFVVHKKANIFKLAYDESWKNYSPGSILTQYLMKYVIDQDKVKEIDFLTGNDRYKHDWMTQRRQRWRLLCSRNKKAEKTNNIVSKIAGKWLKLLK